MAASVLNEIPKAVSRELESFKTPPRKEVAPVPKIGDRAPPSSNLFLTQPKPTIIVFLRHCGCPCKSRPSFHHTGRSQLEVAEKTFRLFTKFSNRHPEIHCIAVSHSSQADTDQWITEVGGEWEVDVIADPDRDLYSAWGLGLSSTWHALNPWSLYSAYRLGKDEGIWNTPTASGTRWQTSGAFAVDSQGFVRYAEVAKAADYVPDFKEIIKALEGETKGMP
jgi:hypothetical protein